MRLLDRPLAAAARRALGSWWGKTSVAVLAVLLVGVGALAAGGGLRAADLEEERVVAGEPVDLGRIRATVIDHTVASDILTSDLEYVGGEAWLVVRAVVEVLDDETVQMLPDLIGLPDDVELALEPEDSGYHQYPVWVLSADGSNRPYLHPGLPQEILLAWPLGSAQVPEPLDVAVLGSEQYFSRLEHGPSWSPPAPVARLEVPRAPQLPDAVLAHLREDAP